MTTNRPVQTGRRRLMSAAAVVGWLISLAIFSQAATQRNGKIAFTFNHEIHLMNPDGTNQTRLTTNNPIIDDHPRWSPDGRKIAFLSQRPTGQFGIFVMNPDGTGRTEIAIVVGYGIAYPFSLRWSPDGRAIVFQGEHTPTTIRLEIVDADGNNRRHLTEGSAPAWSPDGSKILFSNVNGSLATIRPDGGDLRILPVSGGGTPDWHPDSSRFALSQSESYGSVIYAYNADGTGPIASLTYCVEKRPGESLLEGLGTTYCRGEMPDYAPDGQNITWIGWHGLMVGGSLVTNGTNPDWQALPEAHTRFDFDGDGRSDVSVFRPSDRVWYLDRSTEGFSATQFGVSSDKITPADYDDDGKTDIAIYRDGVWYWLNSSSGTVGVYPFGLANDVPVPADYSGDGRDELAVYREGTWWMLDLTNDQVNAVQFGVASDKCVPADYDGDGRVDQAVYRNGEWHLNRSTQGYVGLQWGLVTDRPVVGDYDGDAKADLAVYRDGTWYLWRSTEGLNAFPFGVASDTPAPADYDGDGRTDAAVYRDGTWYLLQSTSGSAAHQFGVAGDLPLPAAYLP